MTTRRSPIQPRSPLGWIGFLGVAVLVVGLALGLRWFFTESVEPRYLGKTQWEWFPQWTSFNPAALSLTNAPPEAVPMLLAAVRRPNSAVYDLWNRVQNAYPSARAVNGTPPFLVRDIAGMALVASAREPRVAAALTSHWATLNEFGLRELLVKLGLDETPPVVVRQLGGALVGTLGHTNADRALESAVVLMRDSQTARPHFARILALICADLKRPWPAQHDAESFLLRVGDLGPVDSALVQPLVDLHLPKGRIRITGDLALCRLDPAHFPGDGYLGKPGASDARLRIELLGEWLQSVTLKPPEVWPQDINAWLALLLRSVVDDARWDAALSGPGGAGPVIVKVRRFLEVGQSLIEELPVSLPPDLHWTVMLLRQLATMPQQAPGIREALFGGVRSPSRVIRHLCGSALRQPRSSTGADKAMAATCLLEGCEPAAMLQILSRNPEVPISASVWPLIRDLARTGRSDGWVAKPSVSGKEAESLGFPLVPVPVPQLAEAIVSQSAH